MRILPETDRSTKVILLSVATLTDVLFAVFVLRFVPGAPQPVFLIPRSFFLIVLPACALALCGTILYLVPLKRVLTWTRLLLTLTLPVAILFAFAWTRNDYVPGSAKIFVSFFALASVVTATAFGARAARASIHSPRVTEPSVPAWFRRQGKRRLALVFFLCAMFFVSVYRDLGRFAAVDEALWLYGRIPKFWSALGTLEPSKTSVSDKPGITVTIAEGAALLAEPDPLRWKSFRGSGFHDIESFFRLYRLPIVAVATLLLPLFYFILERHVRKTEATFAFAFVALSPVTIGMTKIINPDSFLWLFAPMSFFAWLAYLKRRHVGYLLLSGALLGLALLTKYVANFLFVFVLVAILLEFVFREEEEPFLPYLRRNLIAYGIWTLVALTVFFLLFPATWVKPWKLLEATIFSQAFTKVAVLFLAGFTAILADVTLNRARIIEAASSRLRRSYRPIAGMIFAVWILLLVLVCGDVWAGMRPFDFMEILSAPKALVKGSTVLGVFASNAYPLVFGVTPIVFLLLVAAPFVAFRKEHLRSAAGKSILYGILFILFYYAATTVNQVGAITRYQIMLFPVAATIAGITLGLLVRSAKARLGAASPLRSYLMPIILGIVALSGLYTLLRTPFPLSYASVLLPKSYSLDVKDMGPGSYEAATFLNALPDARTLTVWSDKDGVCKFFDGTCKASFDWNVYEHLAFDYVVVSAGRESRTTKRVGIAVEDARKDVIRFDEYYGKADPVWELLINGRPSHYVRIYRVER